MEAIIRQILQRKVMRDERDKIIDSYMTVAIKIPKFQEPGRSLSSKKIIGTSRIAW